MAYEISELAIVGASVRSAAHSAIRAGWQPTCADQFVDADLKSVCQSSQIEDYPEAFLDWLEQTQCDGWIYTGGLENHPELVDRMASRRPLLGNRGSVLRAVRSPGSVADTLGKSGFLFPETHLLTPGDLHQDYTGNHLLKTCRQSSGHGVLGPISDPDVRSRQIRHVGEKKTDPLYMQQCVDGTAFSVTFIGWADKATLLGLVRQLVGQSWTRAAKYQYCGSIGPDQSCTPAMYEQIACIGDVLVQQFGLRGLFGIDLMIDGDRIWTIEVNPRYTASVEILERATGIRAMAWHVEACCQADEPVQDPGLMRSEGYISIQDGNNTHGKVILFAKHQATISEHFVHKALEEAKRSDWPSVADIPNLGTVIKSHQPIMTLFAQGSSVDHVEQILRQRVVDFEQSLYSVG